MPFPSMGANATSTWQAFPTGFAAMDATWNLMFRQRAKRFWKRAPRSFSTRARSKQGIIGSEIISLPSSLYEVRAPRFLSMATSQVA